LQATEQSEIWLQNFGSRFVRFAAARGVLIRKAILLLGEPMILDVNDRAAFAQLAESRLPLAAELSRKERLGMPGTIK
jgi:hypothetical protein